MEIYKVDKNHWLYKEIYNIMVIYDSFYFSIGHKTNTYTEKIGLFSIENISKTKAIKLRLNRPFDAALNKENPEVMEIKIIDLIEDSITQEEDKWIIKNKLIFDWFKDTFDYVIFSFFLSYYERNIKKAESKFPKDCNTWPTTWRLGWVIRNALSHNGKVHYKNMKTPAVTRQNITISPKYEDEDLLWKFVNTWDLLILLFKMNDDLNN